MLAVRFCNDISLAAAGCQSNPCLNGGTCDDGLYYPNYWCACIPPWSGSNCDYYVPTPSPAGCQSNPCLNGGTCDDGLYYPNYWCACIPPWSGSNCDYYVTTPSPGEQNISTIARPHPHSVRLVCFPLISL
uniref:Versican core protein-like n=1 Tax=Petromyzon marinus TaxID=7757 RepID=A0AAJ7WXX6_PETMA|nr:versican core protein-like [Petromyzon marinus]